MNLRPNEQIIKEDDANHLAGMEFRGGKLTLTNQRLYFKPHILNIETDELSVELGNIESVEKCNTLLIVPNGMKVKTKSGAVEQFVVMGRGEWMEKINENKLG